MCPNNDILITTISTKVLFLFLLIYSLLRGFIIWFYSLLVIAAIVVYDSLWLSFLVVLKAAFGSDYAACCCNEFGEWFDEC